MSQGKYSSKRETTNGTNVDWISFHPDEIGATTLVPPRPETARYNQS